MIKAPPPINFKKLTQDIEKQIEALTNLIKSLEEDKQTLIEKDKLTKDEKQYYDFLVAEIIDKKQALEAKQNVYNEYLLRVKEVNIAQKAEKEDYNKNFKKVYRQALNLKKDIIIAPELRQHLGKVLKNYNKNFDQEQKILFYLALKKEVNLCLNFRQSLLK